jgi:ubiquinone/menaquinone biosynthesis C-methylase UbiE
MAKKKAQYGWYALPKLAISVGVIVGIGIVIGLLWLKWLGVAVGCFGVYLILSHGITLYVLNRRKAPEIEKMLKLKGSEKVLDVGCGLGRMSIGVAKLLTTGRVVGIDIWDKMELLSNRPERAYQNAEIEGVRDKVEFKTGNILSIPFPDGSFDLVTCSSVVNNLHTNGEKLDALQEIFRVLKPSGTFLLMEPIRSLDAFFLFTPLVFWMLPSKDRWFELLNKAKFTPPRYSYWSGMGIFATERSE